MFENLKREDFSLKKCKSKDGKITFIGYVSISRDGEIHNPRVEDEINYPHPDLVDMLKALTPILNRSWGFLKNIEAASATGIDASGLDDFRGVIITGKKAVKSGAVAMNSPRIRLAADTYGFEGELDDLVRGITTEIWEYLVNGKSAQMQIAFQENHA